MWWQNRLQIFIANMLIMIIFLGFWKLESRLFPSSQIFLGFLFCQCHKLREFFRTCCHGNAYLFFGPFRKYDIFFTLLTQRNWLLPYKNSEKKTNPYILKNNTWKSVIFLQETLIVAPLDTFFWYFNILKNISDIKALINLRQDINVLFK